ncbi:short chain dehydrogenase [Colletotrichum acutatum]
MADQTPRADLTKRQIPFMTLATGDTATLPGGPARTASASDTPESRFALPGTAVLTGGTGAIAHAVARAMLQHGLTGLMLLDLDVSSPAAETQIASLRTEFPATKILARSVDVTDEGAVKEAMEVAASELDGIDYLVFPEDIGHQHHGRLHLRASRGAHLCEAESRREDRVHGEHFCAQGEFPAAAGRV